MATKDNDANKRYGYRHRQVRARLHKVVEAGLDSVRVSLNSLLEDQYTSYYQPRGYKFSDVLECMHIAQQNGLIIYLNYLHMSDTTLTFPQTLVLRYSRFEPPERLQPQVAEDYGKWFHARLRTLEAHVAGHEFLCAGRFTAADVAVGYALMLAELLGLDDRFTPAVAVYWQRLSGRAAYRRALAAQDSAAREQGVSPLPATA